jgi:hypothetical protein
MTHHIPGSKPFIAVGTSGVLLAALLCIGPASSASAATTQDETHTLQSSEVTALFAGVDDQHALFDGAVARAAGADERSVRQFAAGYEAGGGIVTRTVVDPSETGLLPRFSIACSGKNSFDVTGAQANLYINSCKTDQIRKGLLAGASIATLVGAVTAATGGGAAAGAVAAAGLALGAGVIAFYDNGRGVQFYANPLKTGIRSQ